MKIEDVWNEWTVESVIGSGSFGTVYKCFREVYGKRRYAAVKVISFPQGAQQEQNKTRASRLTKAQTKLYYEELLRDCLNEIKIMEALKDHPNVVHIEDSKLVETEEAGGWQLFIRMELLTPFRAYAYDRTFGEQDVIRLASDLTAALKACSEKNIVHRDIKPENIFVDHCGNFKLGDFGTAKCLEHAETVMSCKGTFRYMAPEVLSAQQGDSRADIYSLGILMYQLLNNRRLPFLDPEKSVIPYSEREAAFRRRTIDGEPLHVLPHVSPELNAVILKATQFKKEDRFPSVAAFAAAIAALTQKKQARKTTLTRLKNMVAAVLAAVPLFAAVFGVTSAAVASTPTLALLFGSDQSQVSALNPEEKPGPAFAELLR